ncbi:MAG: glycerol-3-phosphate dehydrogenase [bacterium]|nr:glycerol-3-phosphate dehydrogenase [bacterium]
MGRITIIGAGFMGSSLSIPATDNGHTAALWGTHLDGHIIAALRAHQPHPKLGIHMPERVHPYAKEELAAALEGADLVILAVISEAALPVLERARPFLPPDVPLAVVSKGLVDWSGRVVTISTAIAAMGVSHVVTIGGPSKALELAWRVPTRVLYASPNVRARQQAREWFQTSYYRVDESDDQQGLELCSALKNAYAIAIGLCDGLVAARRAEAMYNTKAALFAQALVEMERLGRQVHLQPATLHALGGAGDLFVTAVAGRNRKFGELRGSGLPTAAVVELLQAQDELTEGYGAIRWCWRYASESGVQDLPLLRALHRIVYEDQDVETELRAACFVPGGRSP